ncbi:MAG: hypothetical protein ACRDQ7_04455 [Haloechinothrix sp.]
MSGMWAFVGVGAATTAMPLVVLAVWCLADGISERHRVRRCREQDLAAWRRNDVQTGVQKAHGDAREQPEALGIEFRNNRHTEGNLL